MRISGIRAEDAGKLFALDRLCFSIPWSEQSFRDEAKNPLAVYFLAWEEDMLLGYCGFGRFPERQILRISPFIRTTEEGELQKSF